VRSSDVTGSAFIGAPHASHAAIHPSNDFPHDAQTAWSGRRIVLQRGQTGFPDLNPQTKQRRLTSNAPLGPA
jgi:hypothetical protein